MIRFALRLFRTPAIVAAAGITVLAVVVVATRPHLVDVYNSSVRGCDDAGTCDTAIPDFLETYRTLRGWLGVLVVITPGLIGAFWGAPLVAREIETGTFRLAWTQSVTRSRWIGARLAVVGFASVVVSGSVSLLVTWWARLPDRVAEDAFGSYDLRDIVPIGHAVFAFALGVTAGTILRKLLPAMAVTLVGFTGARLAFTHLLRPRLPGVEYRESALDVMRTGFGSRNGGPVTLHAEPPHLANAWFHSSEVVDTAGDRLTTGALAEACPRMADLRPPTGPGSGRGPVPNDVHDTLAACVEKLSEQYHALAAYHPAGRYWDLQWLEVGIHVGVAAALAGVCWWWLRARVT